MRKKLLGLRPPAPRLAPLEYRGLRIKGGHIVYIVLEGHVGFKRRIEAFKREHPESKARRSI